LPSQASSCGGLPTTMDGVDRVAPQATERGRVPRRG
jgi:hypothetical protein